MFFTQKQMSSPLCIGGHLGFPIYTKCFAGGHSMSNHVHFGFLVSEITYLIIESGVKHHQTNKTNIFNHFLKWSYPQTLF